MIKEFAVEPSLFGEWQEFRYLHEKFGVSKARMIARFPKTWQRMVYESATGFTEMQKKYLEVWLEKKDDFLVFSGRDYPIPNNWLESAEIAHAQSRFHAILATENPRENSEILVPLDIPIDEHPLFQCPTECSMPRNLEGFKATTGFLLKHSKQIVFVDPYFTANARWGKALRTMLFCVSSGVCSLRYCTRIAPHRNEVDQNRIYTLKNELPRFIPQNLSIEIILLQRDSGIDTHNRYLLTERGGLKFPWGLDAPDNASRDIINIMESATSSALFNEYNIPAKQAIAERFTIFGEAR